MSDDTPRSTRRADVERWLRDYGDALYRYALMQTRHRETAEDLVQETLSAALHTRNGCDGRASEKTWLIGILKHKLTDHYRRCARSPLDQRQDLGEVDADADIDTQIFRADGRWREVPKSGGDPVWDMEAQTFWQTLQKCLGTLPTLQSAVFLMREIEDFTIEETAEAAAVSHANIYVLLHRARLGLRRCLRQAGFGGQVE
ncbi:MAG: sigma-70 family RNA polymerase sigma factor [Acidiferrobacter sp.]